jgi:hypothetical protein
MSSVKMATRPSSRPFEEQRAVIFVFLSFFLSFFLSLRSECFKTSETCASQKAQSLLSKGVLSFLDNVRPHSAAPIVEKIKQLELLRHLSHNLGLDPSDYPMFEH